jgi:hypothetical protein
MLSRVLDAAPLALAIMEAVDSRMAFGAQSLQILEVFSTEGRICLWCVMHIHHPSETTVLTDTPAPLSHSLAFLCPLRAVQIPLVLTILGVVVPVRT